MKNVDHGVPHTLNYHKITDHIFLGNNVCCKTSFDSELLSKGIEVDISLEEERIDKPFGVKLFTWIPVKDHTAPMQDQLEYGVAAISKAVEMNKKVYVHCQNGHGRAPTLVAAYLIFEGKTADEAIGYIKERRPVIHLEDEQIDALNTFSKKYAK